MIKFNYHRLIRHFKTSENVYKWLTVVCGNEDAITKTEFLKDPTSFLCRPRALIEAKESDHYKAEYLGLAARRNLWDYEARGQNYLNLDLYPEVKVSRLELNPLLFINNNRLYFIQETKLEKR